ncbi:MRAS2 [Anopheles darlingi]|uniref:MRAS2 n=1 Tax=Anopheles darlingi TaxID=43151 RepID=W5JNZ7_ANODA|nr:MRAS2 [Anopheles darlingi]
MQGPLKVAFLGASGVGRTSILQQFFKHDFPKQHLRTTKRTVYRSCLVCDTCIRELMVLDVPPQKYFPVDNLAEWNNGHPLGLRTVHTYVLVYDMGNLETFQIGDIFKELMGYPVGGTAPKLEFSQSIRSKNRCTIL